MKNKLNCYYQRFYFKKIFDYNYVNVSVGSIFCEKVFIFHNLTLESQEQDKKLSLSYNSKSHIQPV